MIERPINIKQIQDFDTYARTGDDRKNTFTKPVLLYPGFI
jgi:hypothetical protein